MNVYDSDGNLTWGQTDKQMLQVSKALTDIQVYSSMCAWAGHPFSDCHLTDVKHIPMLAVEY